MKNAQMTPGRFAAWAQARARLRWINGNLDRGRWVYIRTHHKTTVIKPRDREKFEGLGLDLFRATKGGLFLARGRAFDCINCCNISVTDQGEERRRAYAPMPPKEMI